MANNLFIEQLYFAANISLLIKINKFTNDGLNKKKQVNNIQRGKVRECC